MKNTWRYGDSELTYVREVLDSGFGASTSGDMCKRLEKAFAEKVGSKYAIASSSGTSTLHQALAAVGVGAGDEVIIPPLTVISNVDVVLAQNAIPVFADVDQDTFNMDPKSVAERITDKTKAIMPVSLYGLSCDLDPLMDLGRKYNIPVINDAAEAHMAVYKNKPIAPISDITSYSLENSKHISCGDGGIVVTNDEELAIRMRKFGCLGYASIRSEDGRVRARKIDFQDPTYKRHDMFAFNYRLPEVAAAVGLAQVERMDYFIDLHLKGAELYAQAVAGCDYIRPQKTPDGSVNTYWCYTVRYVRDDVSWYDFRDKYLEFGGDGIYAAWALTYNETFLANKEYKKRAPYLYNDIDFEQGLCPVAEEIQPQLMQFVNNYGFVEDMERQADALAKTIQYYN